MSREIFQKCLDIVKNSNIPTVDITGGAPEMNPNLEWFIKEVTKLSHGAAPTQKKRLIVRSNLVILLADKFKHFIDLYAENGVEVVASMPHFNQGQTDVQRGDGVFDKLIRVIKLLNEKGYAQEGSKLQLNLVHNPVGSYLPGSQQDLEHEYKTHLKEGYDVTFNNLFAITNMPIGRYLEYLMRSENFEDYMQSLVNSYNPGAVDNVMCRSTISVDWQGTLFDCDFNQMLGMSVNHGTPNHINNFDLNKLDTREIVIANHCYGCTAGTGSSCQGATTPE